MLTSCRYPDRRFQAVLRGIGGQRDGDTDERETPRLRGFFGALGRTRTCNLLIRGLNW